MDRDFAELMIEPHDAPVYGLGVFIREPRGDRRYVGHIGDGPGFVGGFTAEDRGQYGSWSSPTARAASISSRDPTGGGQRV